MKDFAEKSKETIFRIFLVGLSSLLYSVFAVWIVPFGVENAMHREFKGFHYNFCVNFSCEQLLRHEVSRKWKENYEVNFVLWIDLVIP